jgi:UDP-N-acetylmuramyl pentapeptide phosphotransferase/UDP-N-acetylglucosamine-1-phosphate transferase
VQAQGLSWPNVVREHNHRKEIMKRAGIILIVIGVIALVYKYIPITETKQDAQIGSLNISHQETHEVPIPQIVGGVLIVAGVVALVAGGRGTTV